MPNQIVDILNAVRVSDWWKSKFGTFFAIIYATAILHKIPFYELLPVIGFLLLALIPGACFVSIINDLTDIEEDKLVGKKNFFAEKSKPLGYFLIFICLLFGAVVCLFLSKISLLLYLAAWIVFSFYSIPPFRLKNRGVFGVLADALGAYLFPQIFVISVLSEWFQKDLNLYWFGAVGVWSMCLGLRGIISHQFTDKKNDEKAGVKTFVRNYSQQFIKKLLTWLIFPLEIIAFGAMIFVTQNYWALILFLTYLLLTLLSYFLLETKFAVVGNSKYKRLFLADYYFVFLPISFIISGLFPLADTWIIVVLHLILFAGSIGEVFGETARIFYRLFLFIREFLLGY